MDPQSPRLLHLLAARLPAVAERLIERYTQPAAPSKDGEASRSANGDKATLQHIEVLLKLLRWAESEIARTGTGTGEAAPAAASYEIPDRDGMERVRAQARATLATIGGET